MLGAVEVSSLRSLFSVRVDGMHSETRYSDYVSSRLTGVTANLVYHLAVPRGPARIYLLGGLGINHLMRKAFGAGYSGCSPDCPPPTTTYGGLGGGAGVSVGTRPARLFGEARYISVLTSGGTDFSGGTKFVLITAGVSFGQRSRPEHLP